MKKHTFYTWRYTYGEQLLQQVDGYDLDGECGIHQFAKGGCWHIVEYTTGWNLGTPNSTKTRKEAVELYPTLKNKIAKHKRTPRYKEQVQEFDKALAKLMAEQKENKVYETFRSRRLFVDFNEQNKCVLLKDKDGNVYENEPTIESIERKIDEGIKNGTYKTTKQ